MRFSLAGLNLWDILNGETLHYVITAAIFLLSALFGRYLSPQAYRFSFVRRMFKELERYAGLYVQVIQRVSHEPPGTVGRSHSDEVSEGHDLEAERARPKGLASMQATDVAKIRYSVLRIHYNRKDDKYVLTGSQYDTRGRRNVVFVSHLVGMKKDVLTSIEFVWKTELVGSPELRIETTKMEGYTEMTFSDSDVPNVAEGDGFFISFRPNAEKFGFKFFRLSDEMVAKLGVTKDATQKSLVPTNEEEREDFVRSLHGAITKCDRRGFFGGSEVGLPFV